MKIGLCELSTIIGGCGKLDKSFMSIVDYIF
jgi:hypothetical protein